MNKFILFLCFLLSTSFIKSEVINGIDVNDLFDKFIVISKGLTDNTEYKCTKILTENKDEMVKVTENAIKKKQGLSSALFAGVSQLIFVPGFAQDCNVGSIMIIVQDLLKAEGIKRMGQNMIDNANELETLFKELKEASDNNTRLIVIGKIIRKITGITFH